MDYTLGKILFLSLALILIGSTQLKAAECRRVLGVGNRVSTVGDCLKGTAATLGTALFPSLITENGFVRSTITGRPGDIEINKTSGEPSGAINDTVIRDMLRYYLTYRNLFVGENRSLVEAFIRWAMARFPEGISSGGAVASKAGGGHETTRASQAQAIAGGNVATTSRGEPASSSRPAALSATAKDAAIDCKDPNRSTCTTDTSRRNVALANQEEQAKVVNEFENSEFGRAASRTGNRNGNLLAFVKSKLPPMDDVFKKAATFVKAGLQFDKSLDADTVREISEGIDNKLRLLYFPKTFGEAASYFQQCGFGFTDNALFDDRNDRVTLCWGRVLTALAVCGARNRPIENCLIRTLMHEIGHYVEKVLKQKANRARSVRSQKDQPVIKLMDCYYDNFSDRNLSRDAFRSSAAMGENVADYVAGLGYKAKFNLERTDVQTNAQETKEGFANICGIPASSDHPASSFRLNVNSAPTLAPELGCRVPPHCTFSGLTA